jgi:hypothetical protein
MFINKCLQYATFTEQNCSCEANSHSTRKRIPHFHGTRTFIPELTKARHTDVTVECTVILLHMREVLGLYLLPATSCNNIVCGYPELLH